MDKMDYFKAFTYKYRGLINKELSYYNLSYEEKIQECAVVYFSHMIIEHLFVSGKGNEGFSIFKTKLRESSRKYSKTGMRIKNNKTYENSKIALSKMESSFELETSGVEDDIMSSIDFDRVNDLVDKESFDFLMFYFDNGGALTSIKYNATEPTIRSRVKRLITKIKEEI